MATANPFAEENLQPRAANDSRVAVNPFSEEALQASEKTALRGSLLSGQSANPDQTAEAVKLSRKTGAPYQAIQDNLPEVQQGARLDDYEKMLAGAPATRRFLTAPQNAAMANDDVGGLTEVEKAIRSFMGGGGGRIKRPDNLVMNSPEYAAAVRRARIDNPALDDDAARSLVMSGAMVDNQAARAGAVRGPEASTSSVLSGLAGAASRMPETFSEQLGYIAADILGLDKTQIRNRLANLETRNVSGTPQFETETGKGLYAGGVSTIQNAPGIALSVATGSAAPALALAGAQSAVPAYSKYRERGASGAMAAVGALGEGAVEVATELLPMQSLLKVFGKGGQGAAMQFLKSQFQEQWTEQIATVAQDAIDTAIANPNKTWGEFVAERPGAAYQTFLATLVQTGAVTVAHTAAQKVAGKAFTSNESAARAEEAAAGAETLTKLAEASKLRARDPESFAQFVNQVAEDGDVPAELFINADTLTSTLNQAGITMERLAMVAPAVAAQLRAASFVPGADIRVPVAEFAAAGADITTPLIDHLRETPDAMSRAEAQEYLKTEGDRIQADVETELGKMGSSIAARQQIDAVTARFETDLNAAGRFRPEVNKAYAGMMGNFYATQAARAGMPLEDFLNKYQLRVTGKTGQGAQTLEQVTPAQAMETNTVLEMPGDPVFAEAVGNTPGAQVTPDGLLIDLVRYQKPEQEAGQAIRTGVFYLPTGSASAKHYKTGKTGYGGTEKMQGQTLLRRPLFVKGATGGKAPEAAYNQINGKKSYEAMRKAVLDAISGYNMHPSQRRMNVALVLEEFDADPGLAAEIVENSQQGNTLAYAVQENIVAHAVRAAGYDSVVGYSKGKTGTFVSEVFDVREQTFPSNVMNSQIHDSFLNQGPAQAGQAQAATNSIATTVERAQAAVADFLGSDTLPNALGRVVTATAADIKSTWEPLIGRNVQMESEGDAGAAQAFYDPASKTVFLIADNIRAGDEAAVLAHELMHKHGQVALGKDGWNKLHSVIGTWANAPEDSDERAVYKYASSKVKAVGEQLSSQEMFPYAVEAALKMGVQPSKKAKAGTVSRWLNDVQTAMKTAWDKVTGKPEAFDTQDLVNLAYGIAQMENPALALANSAQAAINPVAVAQQSADPETGLPQFAGSNGLFIGFAAPTERLEFIPTDDSLQMLNFVIMRDGQMIGSADLLFEGDKLAALYDIELDAAGRGKGDGAAVIQTLLGADPLRDVNISNIVESARGFWESVGVPTQNLGPGEAYDGTLNWQTYTDSRAGQRAARGNDSAGAGQVPGAEAGAAGAGQSGDGQARQLNQSAVDQTATPQFKKWFGDSKVVDDAGKPLVVYHGTITDFKEFDPNIAPWHMDRDKGKHFFYGEPAPASEYAEAMGDSYGDGGANVIPAYLSFQKPHTITVDGEPSAEWDMAGGRFEREAPAGTDGYIVKGIGHDDKPSTMYVATKPTQIKSAIGNNGDFDPANPSILAQGEGAPRATLNFASDITQAPSVIALLEGADLSSFLHESGHFFLEVQADLAARIQLRMSFGDTVSEAERGIVDDMNTLLKWFGVVDMPEASALDQWAMKTLEERREAHETFARGFERYAMEGKAPTQELAGLFNKFRSWLVSIYQKLANLNVTLTDDVRGVMDRMLASDEAIAEAQAARNMGPLFQSPEQAGMTPTEYDTYQFLGERATAAASEELDARLMKDMKWLSRAKDKALKAAQSEVEGLRSEFRMSVRAEVMAQPVYRAWEFLTSKAVRAEPGTQAVETIDPTYQSGKLRTSYLKESHPDMWEILSKRRMTSDETGMDPDIVADIIPGFESGDQLVRALAEAQPPAEVIEAMTDERMLQVHGDINSQEALARAADEAVHNQLRAKVIATELKTLTKAMTVKESGDSLLSRSTVDVMARAAENYANDAIGRQRIKDLRPKQYGAAEARSAKMAAQALGKDLAEAAMHKRNQLINNFAEKAAYAAQKEVAADTAFFRKIVSGAKDKVSKTRDFDVVQAARAILADYGVGTKGEAAQKYLEAVAQNDPGMYAVLRDKVDNLTARAKPLAELTVEEFRGLAEEIKGLWHMAKRSRQIEIDGAMVSIERAKMDLRDKLEEIGVPDRVPGEGRAVTDAERRLTKLQTARAALRRVESWAGAKDGGAGIGPFRKYVWQPVKESADRYRADKAKYLKEYRNLLADMDVGKGKIAAPELGYTFGFSRGGSGKAELLHAILHTGNESNKRKLLLGRDWAVEREEGGLDTSKWDGFVNRMIADGTLTKKDFDFAQGVWDLLDSMKPLAQKTHRDVFGRYFDEVTADPFTNAFGTYRGGYVPAMTDAEVVKDAATRSLQEDENQTLAYAFPTTSKGFTKARVEYNKPLLLDLRSLSQHIDKVLLFSHLEPAVRDVRKILASNEVSEPLHRMDPTAFDGILTPWLNRAARQSVETKVPGDNNLMRFFSKARSRAGLAAMFANFANTAQQITGLSIAALKVPPKYLMPALATYVQAPRQTAKAVAENSIYMASRMDNEVAQLSDQINDILLNPSLYEQGQAWAMKHAYFMQSAVDNMIGPIVWTGAYNQAVEAGASDRDAIRLADSAVRETQGSTLAEDVSRIETGNSFVRMFTQFAGYFNMQANLMGTEFAKNQRELGLRRGMGRGLYIFTLGFLVPAMLSELIVQAFRGGPDDEDKDGVLDDWLMAVLVMGNVRAALGMVPLVGPMVNAGINTFNKKPYDDRISTSPAISMVESAVSAPHSVYKAVADDGSARKAVRDVATLITMTTGLPATAIARPAGYLSDVMQGRTEPTSAADAVRGAVTGVSSPESKQ